MTKNHKDINHQFDIWHVCKKVMFYYEWLDQISLESFLVMLQIM